MKKLFTPLMIVAVAALLGACGKNTTSNNNNNNGSNICGTNQYWNGYQCVDGSGTISGNRVAFADGSGSFQMSGYQFSGNLRITDQTGYKAFLKEALGICDRNIWGYSSGLAKCSTWAAGQLYVSFNMGSNMVPALTFTAYPPSSFYQYYVNIGINAGGMAYNPLILSSSNTYNMIEKNQGFEVRANGPWGTSSSRYLIQLIVRKGTIKDSSVTYELAYKNGNVNKVFATGVMKKVY